MKNKKKKILISILIIFLLLFCLGGRCFADNNIIEGAIDGLVGVLLLPAKFIVLIFGGIIGTLLGFFSNVKGLGITLEDILFNRVPLTDINFFDFSTTNDIALTIRENVAIWYTSIRNIAAVVLAIIAVYVGIRMAISTIAEDKAKYKTMLYDWLTSLALLFVLQYIMIFTININNAFINVLSTGLSDTTFGSMTDTFLKESITNLSFTTGLGCALIYMMLQGVTFVFLLSYIKRMITLAFLIVISPLVTITYSIDKMGDGRSQALNVWFKEFVYNILIQPFHCVSYRVLAQSSIELMVTGGFASGAGLANAVIAIMLILFIYTSEEIIKHIFHFESQSMGKTVTNAAIGGFVLNKVMSGGKKSKGGSSSKGYASGTNNSKSTNKNASNTQNSGQNGGQSSGQNSTTNRAPSSTRNNGQGASSSSSSQSNSSSKRSAGSVIKGGAAKIGKGAGKVASAVFKANPAIAGGMIMGGLGLGLGDAKTGIAGMMAGASMGSSVKNANRDRIMKHELARAVNRYKNENPDLTQDEVYNNALHLSDGSLAAQTEAEQELANVMQKMEQRFIANGIDEKKIPKQFKKLISDIDSGKISEYSKFQRFTGNVKSKINTKKQNNNNVNNIKLSNNTANMNSSDNTNSSRNNSGSGNSSNNSSSNSNNSGNNSNTNNSNTNINNSNTNANNSSNSNNSNSGNASGNSNNNSNDNSNN